MRCKNCNYSLWQIKDRKCPECGSPFKPSDFEFNINAVRFCCPVCEQDYYGTGENGHLVPSNFDCVRCGTHIDMDQMVLQPAEGVTERQTETDKNPWLERGTSRGFWSAMMGTIGQALITPGRLLRATPVESSAGSALAFTVLSQLLIVIVSVIPMGLFIGLSSLAGISAAGAQGRSGPAGPSAVAMVGIVLGTIAGMGGVALVGWLISLLIMTVVAHGILKVTGGCAFGIKRTFQAMCYASGANAVSAVPCLGGYFGWIWWMISSCIALKDAQRVHGGRAAAAVITVPVLLVASFIGLYSFFMYSVISSASARARGSVAGAVVQSRVSTLAFALIDSTPPPHVAQLISDGDLSVADLYDTATPGSGSYLQRSMSTPLGSVTLQQFEFAPARRQTGYIQEAVNALPANVVAYRLGDTVFTYCGFDPTVIPSGDAAGKLWVVIAMPAMNTAPTQQYWVGLADGTTTSFPRAMLPAELSTQNALRASVGLAALPDPTTVTETQPAAGATPSVFAIPQGGTPQPSPTQTQP